MWRLAVIIALFFWLAACLNLRIEWTLNEQYTYGWAVPFLCLFLAWGRYKENAEVSETETPQPRAVSFSISAFQRFSVSVFLILPVLLFIATRWVEEANPDWRLVGWMLAGEAVCVSLGLLWLTGGGRAVRRFAFPICFFLVAVPWPTVIEHSVVQTLTRANVRLTVEVLNGFGLAALQHGNVIETTGGLVDIDTACSGIRSLQASLMLALFFGEWKRLGWKRRFALCGASIACAMFFNAARTILLAAITAQRGPAVMNRWHDPAGTIILVACFIGVWAAATWLRRGRPSASQPGRVNEGEVSREHFGVGSSWALPRSFSMLLIALAVLLVVGEIAVQMWYRSAAPVSLHDWDVALPSQNPTLVSTKLPADTVRILRYTDGLSAKWKNPDDVQWQFFYFRWAPGRTAVNLARNHTPDICLPAAGHSLKTVDEIKPVTLNNITIPFRAFVAGTGERPMFVFYSLWEEGAREQHPEAQLLTVRSRWNAVLQRRRNPGQRVIEIAISGARDLAQAEASLRDELPKLIQIRSR